MGIVLTDDSEKIKYEKLRMFQSYLKIKINHSTSIHLRKLINQLQSWGRARKLKSNLFFNGNASIANASFEVDRINEFIEDDITTILKGNDWKRKERMNE